jgi:hypothetical protein
MSFILIDLVA